MSITSTQFEKHLYEIFDRVIDTREPVEITYKNAIFRINLINPGGKLKKFKSIPNLINRDPSSLDDISWEK